MNLPILVLLEKWKRQRTKSQNIKFEKLNAYVPHSRVKSHSLRIRDEIEEHNFKNINKIIMKKKVDKKSHKNYETSIKSSKEVKGMLFQ